MSKQQTYLYTYVNNRLQVNARYVEEEDSIYYLKYEIPFECSLVEAKAVQRTLIDLASKSKGLYGFNE